ncbi:translation initiation factor 2 [Streptomyces sp. CC208A]|uniref:translation initiation factor 2 n=1 Tax=Streptomyces sp. CC208A TaxID=3044573 RepID=UPI0024A91A1B|nr:translation initiation factor 2 [Streptomyces sp. CC208A]
MLVAVRSAVALHRLLDVLPVFHGDHRIVTRFTLMPGSDFGVDALAALERAGVRTLPWEEALHARHDLVLAASPKGGLHRLSGRRVLLPHGAGFNKSVDDGAPGVPSGLDPSYLLADGTPWADLHALAHGDQVARLESRSRLAASRGVVVGDPTLDRFLASVPYREEYRTALGTGARRLVVLASTWGRESLLVRRPGLAAELTALLPYDAYQFALALHPNEHSRIGSFDLSGRLAPALSAGLILAGPYEEWAAVLVAADAVVTDHGSAALYAAALGTPVVNAYDGGGEVLPGSPGARLLDAAPRLTAAARLEAALDAASSVDTRPHAARAFTPQGQALARLRAHLYRLLGLSPLSEDGPDARAFPRPSAPSRRPPAFAVRIRVAGDTVSVTRVPARTREAFHHLCAEFPAAGPRHLQSAGVLWRRAGTDTASGPLAAWTAEGWTERALEEYPGCRTAAAVLDRRRILVRHRSAGVFTARVEPDRSGGRASYPDPSAVVSAVHARLGDARTGPVPGMTLVCDTGPVAVRVHLDTAHADDLLYEL